LKWTKKGVVYCPDDSIEWMVSHAAFPTPLLLDDRIRVYISIRGRDRQSVIGFVDVDREDPTTVLKVHDQPVLTQGKLGTFDDCGVQPMQALIHDDRVYLYYLGWNPGTTVLARNNTGLAVSTDGGETFERAFEGPVLDRTKDEPYFAYTPNIMIENGRWHLWYGSGTAWEEVNGKAEGLFEIKYAYSDDGIDWVRPNKTCIPPDHHLEVNCRPAVIKRNGVYHMWYSLRTAEDFRGGTNSYRIGYAHSTDHENWVRDDENAGINVSKDGWDSEMICFCSVMETDGKLHMFYNGNGFGLTGFGHAIMDSFG